MFREIGMDICQEIWDADQKGNGVKPIPAGTEGDAATG